MLFDKNVEEIKILSLFAEGKISVYEFWELFNSSEKLKKMIINDKLLPIKNKPFLYDIDLRYIYHRCEVYRVVSNFFKRRNKTLDFYNIDTMIYTELLNIVPSYVDIDSDWFKKNILENCPFAVNTKERNVWIKDLVGTSFAYKNKPPKWLQNPEWPIGINGPLVFVEQSGNPDTIMEGSIKYVFLNDFNEEVIVEQFD